jgi:hypothetical protein
MLKKHMAASLVATALAAPAFAQSPATPSTDRPTATGTHSTTSGSPAMVPGGSTSPSPSSAATSGPSGATAGAAASGASGSSPSDAYAIPAPRSAGSSPASGAGGAGSGAPSQTQFVAQQQQGQWLASKLIGTRVVSANNETIGDVNDVLLDRAGTAQAIVIGVGGFLGIGEKDVAVPFSALEFASSRDTNTTGSTSDRGAGAVSSMTGPSAGASSNATRNGGETDRIVLRLTKADLQAAPTFQSSRAASLASGSGMQPANRAGAAREAPAPGGAAAPRP